MDSSPFRAIPQDKWLVENRSGFAIFDAYPVSEGHALVIPFRNIATLWEAETSEQSDLLALVTELKHVLDSRFHPDGYNIGFNAGAAAGQTLDHLHIHVIPRYQGDVPDPRGGIREVISSASNYLTDRPSQAPARTPAQLYDASQASGMLRLELVRALGSQHLDRIDLVVSFIMRSGLELILPRLSDAVARGATVRVLTTDYMDVTDPDALAELLDLLESATADRGSLAAKVWQDPRLSFHPKAYLFSSSTGPEGIGFVGSSNLSKSGIDGGVEWNLGVREVGDVGELIAAFDRLWHDQRAVDLTHDLLRNYRAQRKTPDRTMEPDLVGVEIDPPRQPVAPTPIQVEAINALETTRAAAFRAGLVVMATGLGKTWLAAFDSSRPAVRRTLFVAHREEILTQSRDVFRQVRPDAELGLFYGKERQPDADVVFASVQTLSRRLAEFSPDAFDYVVIDEFHHAAAGTYRRVIDYFDPAFLLGLTATPERMDGADLLALCGDNLVYECDLVQGIERAELVPFSYWGLKDVADFEPIPWRNGRFDPDALAQAVETQARADQALESWRDKGGGPTLAFCCSVTHADFMAKHFTAAGVRAVAVHSGSTSAPRQGSVQQLRDQDVEVIFTVDVFNEGLDVPEIETVLMLRPTESPVIFLQQLGRGLCKSPGKERLRVIDFIGNHHSFLNKPRTLLSLGGRAAPTPSQVVDVARRGDFNLPEGCSVVYEVEAIDLLASMTRRSTREALADFCLEYTEANGYRPSAVQAFRSGFNLRSARPAHGHWFGLLRDLELLTNGAAAVVERHGDVLTALEKEHVTKSYKLVALRAMLHDGTLRTGADVQQLAATSHGIVASDPRLTLDATNDELPDPVAADGETWSRFWLKWPIEHLANDSSRSLFQLRENRLIPTFAIAEDIGEAFDAMAAELIEWRLAEYLLRNRLNTASTIRCRVSHAEGRPIIWLDRSRYPQLPEGWTRHSEPTENRSTLTSSRSRSTSPRGLANRATRFTISCEAGSAHPRDCRARTMPCYSDKRARNGKCSPKGSKTTALAKSFRCSRLTKWRAGHSLRRNRLPMQPWCGCNRPPISSSIRPTTSSHLPRVTQWQAAEIPSNKVTRSSSNGRATPDLLTSMATACSSSRRRQMAAARY